MQPNIVAAAMGLCRRQAEMLKFINEIFVEHSSRTQLPYTLVLSADVAAVREGPHNQWVKKIGL